MLETPKGIVRHYLFPNLKNISPPGWKMQIFLTFLGKHFRRNKTTHKMFALPLEKNIKGQFCGEILKKFSILEKVRKGQFWVEMYEKINIFSWKEIAIHIYYLMSLFSVFSSNKKAELWYSIIHFTLTLNKTYQKYVRCN